ncbi:MAG: ribose-5-phosphate isomerase RpiA [Beijerinckiaceae bacterium]|nr:ribose-5-phosphate isomerase RpiA [Beijerinckiaceae bacterium]
MSPDDLKREAAAMAVKYVQPGMRLGLGTGSTAKHFVDLLAERVRGGLNVVGVPTSEATRAQAESLGVPLTTLDETPELDLTIDGADEFDPGLRLIKGGGGALLREKIVARASARMIVITDGSKRVERLGRFPLPVEVAPFGVEATRRAIAAALKSVDCAGEMVLRQTMDGATFVTDGGHYIFDCSLGVIPDAEALACALAGVPGVMEHGLFLGLADAIIVAAPDGVEVIGSPEGRRSR